MQIKPSITERFVLLLPWLLPVWLLIRGLDGEMDGLLVFVLIVIAIPVIFFVNIVTLVVLRGRVIIKQFKQTTKRPDKTPLQSVNYSDLPWWNPRKWRKK